MLKEHHSENVDYQFASQSWEASSHGGLKYFVNVRTFKKLCMRANTTKADTVRNYEVKMLTFHLLHSAVERFAWGVATTRQVLR